jgi:hypothetical protein
MDRFLDSATFDVLLALIVPVLWGVLSAWFFERLRARKSRRNATEGREEPGR